ncbi:MAG: hypothetical protein GC160_25125 [Acidobacteria bacterium]|nr:hypothetical protein [Acidobacteriota bacterium]
MRSTLAFAAVFGSLTLAPIPSEAAEKLTGLIAYADCAEDGKITEAEHAKCAQGKNRDDQVLVFVPEKNPKKVLELLFEDPADPYVGKMVEVEGVVEDNFLEIQKIKPKK